jgi:hypothetical protein
VHRLVLGHAIKGLALRFLVDETSGNTLLVCIDEADTMITL